MLIILKETSIFNQKSDYCKLKKINELNNLKQLKDVNK